jgi:hypothetical protein
MLRGICKYKACNKPVRNKGRDSRGRIKWGSYCDTHHRGKGGTLDPSRHRLIDNKRCQICGWNDAPCDRHRIFSRDYLKNNTLSICPLCHQWKTLGHKILKLLKEEQLCEHCHRMAIRVFRYRKDILAGYGKENVVRLCPNCYRCKIMEDR